jgi:4'-phosphopantetheinyl transferase
VADRGAVEPAAWRFVPAPGGRPRLDAAAGLPGLSFSLTHTRGLAACAVAPGHLQVGLDAEHLDRPTPGEEIARAYFAPVEVAALLALPPAERAEAFFALWTAKEAYLKAIGTGLALPLDRFAVTLDEPPAIAFAAPPEDDPAWWSLRRHAPRPGHRLALAVRRHPGEEPEIRWCHGGELVGSLRLP